MFGRLVADVKDRSLFPHYLAALKFPERLVRAAVAPLVPQVTAVTDHPAVCELRRSRDDELRSHAARILKQVGGKTALGLVAAMIGERDFAGRREAIDLIVPLAGHHARQRRHRNETHTDTESLACRHRHGAPLALGATSARAVAREGEYGCRPESANLLASRSRLPDDGSTASAFRPEHFGV